MYKVIQQIEIEICEGTKFYNQLKLINCFKSSIYCFLLTYKI
jgi:hypothetical protein